MTTKVLLERLSENRYRATGSGKYALSVEGTNREEALANFQKAATGESATLTEEVVINVSDFPASDPWAWFAGRLVNEPLLKAYEAEIEKARQEDEENENRKTPS